MVALLLPLLLGFAGLVIATGVRAVSQQHLQDGADAAALAVARSCAAGTCDPSLARQYVQADDPGAAAAAVCGSGIAGFCPPGCPLPRTGHWDDVEATSPPANPFPGFPLQAGSFCAQASWHRRDRVIWLTG